MDQPASCRPIDSRGLPTASGASLVAASHLRSEAQGTASLDQTRSRGAIRSRQADAIELGNEPPLSVDGGSSGFVDRRRVSVQWFAGTILTALMRRCSHGRRRFHVARRRSQFRVVARTGRSRAARRARRRRRKRRAQKRPPADRGRADIRAPGNPRLHHQPCRQPRGRARAPVRAHRRQSVAHRFRSFRQYPALQSATAARGSRAGRRHGIGRYAGRRAGRRSRLRDARHGADHAEAQDRARSRRPTK